jgi:hypothetical protein
MRQAPGGPTGAASGLKYTTCCFDARPGLPVAARGAHSPGRRRGFQPPHKATHKFLEINSRGEAALNSGGLSGCGMEKEGPFFKNVGV